MKVLKNITQNILWKNILRWILVVSVFMFLVPGAGYAEDKYWVRVSSFWYHDSNWNPDGQPQNGDNVYLTQSDETNRIVNYRNTVGPLPVLGSLEIDATGNGTMTLQFKYFDDPLAASYEYIGLSGKGAVIQSRGTNTITNDLYLGMNSTSVGTYDLSGTGSLSANYEYIGYNGTGTFTQTGGTNTVSSALYLGKNSTGVGTYSGGRDCMNSKNCFLSG
ncbi:MAG: hypothetical protein KKC46_20830 [Proteobacteria bacterium]|nr:hypothetical protein [Pseudomonadota bacterium]